METLQKQISRSGAPFELLSTREYMPRVHEVRSPCQWLDHCADGKCPAFVRLNGNFYCARKRTPT